nr:MAG TPA: hypothetical protein [Crassvirales sp.]DAX04528.1 MAG TPA: hypothetical protein [Bacteriophage sp.]
MGLSITLCLVAKYFYIALYSSLKYPLNIFKVLSENLLF